MRDDKGPSRLARLPQQASAWLNELTTDPDYQVLDELRDSMIHRHLKRTLYVSTGSFEGQTARTTFHLASQDVDAGAVIRLCADLAHRHVDRLGGLVAAGSIAPLAADANEQTF